jgi:hypothetical protein
MFGTLFNSIYINRINSSNETVQSMKVPLSYGPKEKFLARLEGDPTFNRPAMVLPRMAFEITSISYASDRKLNTLNRNVKVNSANTASLAYQYQSVPYDIGFTLYIMVKNVDDGTRIVEQILPYFTPEWTITANLIPQLGLNVDIPIILKTIGSQDTYEGDFMNRRAIVWTLDFAMKAYLFGPTKKGSIIKTVNTNIYVAKTENIDDSVGVTNIASRITVRPGLLANGSPTSNVSLSVDISQIDASENYGFITEFDSYEDIIQ